MNRDSTDSAGDISRRSVLAAGATGLTLSASGCVDSVESVVSSNGDGQSSISIMTVPADGDRENVQIARHLEANLEAIGVDVSVDMRSRSEFLQAVLIDHDFDCYVGRHPADYDPDFLYGALHSTYASEAGWQNPFGVTRSVALDRPLEAQRVVDGDERRDRIGELLSNLAAVVPFAPICIPDENRVAGGRFEGWDEDHLATRHGYLGLEPQEDVEQLHALMTDSRISRNLNPLSSTLRERGTIIDLLYDSLATERDGALEPWLAESIESETEDGTTTFDITLREDCFFHDEEPLTAEDVAFTYRFLADTALDRAAVASPAPRYRSRVSAIDRVAVDGQYQLTITTSTGSEVAGRALTVPVLPKHRWRDQVDDRSEGDDFTPIEDQGEWGLVTMANVPATGSGPYKFESNAEREHLTLERYDDHFTRRDDDLPEAPVEELRFSIDPGSKSSIERVASGNADVTASMVGASAIGDIPDESGVEQLNQGSRTFYHLGFNTRRPPFSSSPFRRAVAQLIDKSWITENVFYDHASPIATPVPDEWTPDDLAWDGEDPVLPFVGDDGDLDVDRAKQAFEAAGYRYDEEGRLLGPY